MAVAIVGALAQAFIPLDGAWREGFGKHPSTSEARARGEKPAFDQEALDPAPIPTPQSLRGTREGRSCWLAVNLSALNPHAWLLRRVPWLRPVVTTTVQVKATSNYRSPAEVEVPAGNRLSLKSPTTDQDDPRLD